MWAVGVILYFSLKGEPPFTAVHPGAGAVDIDATFENIKACSYDGCDGEDWSAVSDPAKDLIRRLLAAEDSGRLDANAALAHPWIADAKIAAGGEYRLESTGGIARLAGNREATRREATQYLRSQTRVE